ncbi:substrate-binding periplasmic protein [Pseudoalteromonas sp. C12FD-1]|uniref:substrate-binding periplasmic protein n=1 Tax=Pseudoalteromonas sp. C12FD-1 TaxID=3131979 RepID=UPI00307F5B07
MIIKWLVNYALIVATTCSTLAHACSKTLIMGTNETNWPSNLTHLSSGYAGAELKVIKLIFNGADFCVKIQHTPSLSRIHKELKLGRIDFTFSASYTTERAEYGYFSEPYRLEKMKLFKHASNPDVNTLAQVFEQGFTLAINRGSYYGPEVAEYKKRFADQIVYTSHANNRADMVSKHRVDYSIEELRVASPFLKKYANMLMVKSIKNIYTNPVHFMFSKQSVTLQEVMTINKFILSKQADIDKIYQQH